MLDRDVMDKLLDKHRLADAGAAEKPDFAALGVRLEQVDDLDARFEYLLRRLLLVERGRLAVDAPALRILRQRLSAVYRLAADVQHPAEDIPADGNAYAVPRRGDLEPAVKPFAAGKEDAAHFAVADMVGDFHHALNAGDFDGQRFFYSRERAVESDVDDRSGYLRYSAFHDCGGSFLLFLYPAEISVTSAVIALWRAWLY